MEGWVNLIVGVSRAYHSLTLLLFKDMSMSGLGNLTPRAKFFQTLVLSG